VYKARDTRLDRIVALKVFKREFTERFERKARAISTLNHPHICQVHDVGPNYLVMEFIDGAPLLSPNKAGAARAGRSTAPGVANRGCPGDSASQGGHSS
jgi:serine/threonine protein kinase